ncbi:hypothetical protein J4Q44_G00187350 [Coregonus suidteri]|uniref:Uncharacterized protein n=1 Tax=Coregonus suidteri TaxID=861788 RepID=A0AAN8LGD0_9TELE
MIMGRCTACAQELLYSGLQELSEDEETVEEDGPIHEEAKLMASMGLPVEFISSSAQRRACLCVSLEVEKVERRASNSEDDDDDDEPPDRRIAKVKRRHELDVEENPQISVDEAWDKLGLKCSHDPMFETVLKFKPQGRYHRAQADQDLSKSSERERQLSQTHQFTRQTGGALLVHSQRERKRDWRKRSRKKR